MALLNFADYAALEFLDAATLEESVLAEALSGSVAKTGSIAILLKLSGLRQRILQDRNASSSEKALGEAIFWLGSMVAVGIGAMTNDSELVNAARRNR